MPTKMPNQLHASRTFCHFLIAASMLVIAPGAETASAQMINVATPFRTTGDTYYERNGMNFGMSFPGNGRIRGLNAAGQLLPNIQITQGGAGAVTPSFGGYNPNASLRTGFATIGGNPNISFGLELGKGSRRSISSQTPSVTMMNGQFGSIFSGANRPFVTRIDPVIGMGGGRGSSLLRRPNLDSYNYRTDGSEAEGLQLGDQSADESAAKTYSNPHSTATRGDISVADIKAQRKLSEMVQDQQLLKELDDLMKLADDLESQEKYGAARAKYSRALRKVSDRKDLAEVRQILRDKLNSLRGKR